MTQHGETDNYTASDHARAIIDHSDPGVIDACLINSAEVPDQDALGRYKGEASFPVKPDIKMIRDMGYRVYATDLLSVADYVRHDSKKINKALIDLIESHRVIKR
jgi:2-phospho-L-lactate transferase/gluconeogenesis factor (CofD/UPF0052 family)